MIHYKSGRTTETPLRAKKFAKKKKFLSDLVNGDDNRKVSKSVMLVEKSYPPGDHILTVFCNIILSLVTIKRFY